MNYLKKLNRSILVLSLSFISLQLFSQKNSIPKTDTAFSDSTASKFNILSNPFSKTDSIYINDKSVLIDQLNKLEFTSCVIYFSGTGFYNVVTSSITGNGVVIQSLFDRCVPGTRITFEKCRYKTNNTPNSNILHKTIVFK